MENGSFHIEDREKAALVGVNGAGKSTILKMIMGEEPLDKGDVILSRGVRSDILPSIRIFFREHDL